MNVEPFNVLPASKLDKTPPEQRFLIDTLWADSGVGVIGGTPKSCKSWLGLEMAVSVASGQPCLGRFAVRKPGPALIYLAEDGLEIVRDRLDALCQHHGIEIDTLDVRVIVTPSLRLDLECDSQRLYATIARHQPRLLVLDPLVRLHHADENSAQEISRLLAGLRTLQRKHQVAIVLVHHTRKAIRGRQPGQSLRGSGDLHAWGDSNLYLRHQRDALELTVEHRAAAAPEPLRVKLVEPPPHLELVGAPEPEKSLEQRIIEALHTLDEPITSTALRKLLAVKNQRLVDALRILDGRGRIKRLKTGWIAV
jgi:RecA-family ATPase